MVVELGIKLSKIALKGLIKDKQQEITEFSSELKEPEKNEEVDNSPNIDWEDLNYPWGIRLVHYNRAELDASCAKISRIAQIAAFLGYSTLLLNFIDVTVLASMGVFPIRILYSFFDIILVAPAICVNFYLSFLALAMKKPLYTRFYMGSQIALCSASFISFLQFSERGQ
ncbi:uncharacterized protein BcabD6B2_49380 [Babesia caballi]|uniref:Chloroquine resistance transporter n=1 Tax=Babesia caballi TaxID=5871 RepID=A0AAV4LZC0_BABCB|nr:hypothetical protein BcabD6B2_49380 [Babesia caballi]